MNASTHNQAVLANLKKKVQQLVLPNIQSQMRPQCANIINLVRARRFNVYLDFTGNARLGHQFVEYSPNGGVYSWWHDRVIPRRYKIALNERLFLANPYEGRPRTVQGEVKLIEDGVDSEDTMTEIRRIPVRDTNGGLVYRMAVAVEYGETRLKDPLGQIAHLSQKIRITKGKK